MVCGAAALVRGELMLLGVFLAVPVALSIKNMPTVRRVRLLGVVALAAVVTVAPWESYVLNRYEKPVFISYGDGGVLAGANCWLTYSGQWSGSWVGICTVAQRSRDQSVTAARQRTQAFTYMRQRVLRLPQVMTVRVARLWSLYNPVQMGDTSQGEGRPFVISLAGLAMYWVLAPLAVFGALTLRRRRVPLAPILAPVVLVTLVAAAFYGLVRFRAPAEVSIAVLAAVALDAFVDRGKSADRRVAARRRIAGRLKASIAQPVFQHHD